MNSPTTYHLSSLQEFIAQEQIRRDAGARGDIVAQDAEGVKHPLQHRIHRLAVFQVQANDVPFGVFVLQGGDYLIQYVTPSVEAQM